MDGYLKVKSSAARTSFPAFLIVAVLSLGLQASGCRRAADRADGLTLGRAQELQIPHWEQYSPPAGRVSYHRQVSGGVFLCRIGRCGPRRPRWRREDRRRGHS